MTLYVFLESFRKLTIQMRLSAVRDKKVGTTCNLKHGKQHYEKALDIWRLFLKSLASKLNI